MQAIAALRRLRFTGAQIAEILAMPDTTVSGILTRIGMGRLGRLGLESSERYERRRPGELLHVDVKKLGRIERALESACAMGCVSITGRAPRTPPVFVARGIRPCLRRRCDALAYAEVLGDEKATTAVGFLRRALAFYRRQGSRPSPS